MVPIGQAGWLAYLIWVSPLLLVVGLLATGVVGSTVAGLVAAVGAAIVSLTVAPLPLESPGLFRAVGEGAWLAFLVGTVIVSGLFFRNLAAGRVDTRATPSSGDRRTRAFTACFLIGPFTEAATGFGVGQVAAIAMLGGLGLPPIQVILLGLFSQTLVPWGAMANGTMVGAIFAGLPPTDLGMHSAILTVPLLLVWLGAFWRLTARAGISARWSDLTSEFGWVVAIAAGLIAANQLLGPEIAALAILGPLIAVRFWWSERPDRARWVAARRLGLPYATLIALLAATRAIPALATALSGAVSLRPFPDAPAWSPLLHPASWLIAVGCFFALASGRAGALAPATREAWRQGRKTVLTIGLFLVAARIIADSGVAGALAGALRAGLGPAAIVATPLLAGAFGFLTGSSNATNGLLMASQVSLADGGGVSTAWVAALQNTAAAALTMLSPARVAMGCALVGRRDLERETYRRAWWLGAIALAVLTAAAAGLLRAPSDSPAMTRSDVQITGLR